MSEKKDDFDYSELKVNEILADFFVKKQNDNLGKNNADANSEPDFKKKKKGKHKKYKKKHKKHKSYTHKKKNHSSSEESTKYLNSKTKHKHRRHSIDSSSDNDEKNSKSKYSVKYKKKKLYKHRSRSKSYDSCSDSSDSVSSDCKKNKLDDCLIKIKEKSEGLSNSKYKTLKNIEKHQNNEKFTSQNDIPTNVGREIQDRKKSDSSSCSEIDSYNKQHKKLKQSYSSIYLDSLSEKNENHDPLCKDIHSISKKIEHSDSFSTELCKVKEDKYKQSSSSSGCKNKKPKKNQQHSSSEELHSGNGELQKKRYCTASKHSKNSNHGNVCHVGKLFTDIKYKDSSRSSSVSSEKSQNIKLQKHDVINRKSPLEHLKDPDDSDVDTYVENRAIDHKKDQSEVDCKKCDPTNSDSYDLYKSECYKEKKLCISSPFPVTPHLKGKLLEIKSSSENVAEKETDCSTACFSESQTMETNKTITVTHTVNFTKSSRFQQNEDIISNDVKPVTENSDVVKSLSLLSKFLEEGKVPSENRDSSNTCVSENIFSASTVSVVSTTSNINVSESSTHKAQENFNNDSIVESKKVTNAASYSFSSSSESIRNVKKVQLTSLFVDQVMLKSESNKNISNETRNIELSDIVMPSTTANSKLEQVHTSKSFSESFLDINLVSESVSNEKSSQQGTEFKDKISNLKKQELLEKFLKHEENYKSVSLSVLSRKKINSFCKKDTKHSKKEKKRSRSHERRKKKRRRSSSSSIERKHKQSFSHGGKKCSFSYNRSDEEVKRSNYSKEQSCSKDHESKREKSSENKTRQRCSFSRGESDSRHKRKRSYDRSYKEYGKKLSNINRANEKIDKAKLLEHARKSVLTMLEKGTLPERLSAGFKKEELASIKAGGKSVEELTDFCRAISKKENNDDSDNDTVDQSESDQPFLKHPFKIKEQSTIKMNIKNAVQLPIKSHAEKVQENARTLSLQFPVSSGNQHRQKELEWVPVEKTTVSNTPVTATKTISKQEVTKTSVSSVVGINTAPPLPQTSLLPQNTNSLQLPTVLPNVAEVSTYNASSEVAVCYPVTSSAYNSVSNPVYTVPSAGVTPQATQVFPNVTKPCDITAIVARRLKAQRKLQENPNDPDALNELHQTQLKLQSWVQSKMVPGQFTGSTNAKLLSAEELSGPRQAWVKRDIFTRAAPVTEGKGMSLLKKMGWNPGEGLGKNKEGSLEPLVLDIKMDKRGLVSEGEGGGRKIGLRPSANSAVPDMHKKHPVSILMELCSKRRWEPPLYTVIDESGPSHRKLFLFKVLVNNIEYQPSTSIPNKKQAKAQAAILCLQSLGVLPKDYVPPV